MKREDVYKLIDGERGYQDSKPPRPEGDAVTPVSAWLIYIHEHLKRANIAIYTLNKQDALEQVRKIAALAVACMEYNNTKERKE